MNSDTIQFKKSEGVATITLNRPEARNSLTPQMISDLGDAIQSCSAGEVRAVLLTGAGDAFCAGADLKGLVARLENDGPQALSEEIRQVAGTLHEVRPGRGIVGDDLLCASGDEASSEGGCRKDKISRVIVRFPV